MTAEVQSTIDAVNTALTFTSRSNAPDPAREFTTRRRRGDPTLKLRRKAILEHFALT